MAVKAKNSHLGIYIPHTAATDLTGGTPFDLGNGLCGLPPTDIASGDTDSVQVQNIIEADHVAVVGAINDAVWWDSDGDPYNGTAGTGAATTVQADGDFKMGSLSEAATATDATCKIWLNRVSSNEIEISNSTAVTGERGIYVNNEYTNAAGGVHKGIQVDVAYNPATAGYGTTIGLAGKVTLTTGKTWSGGQALLFGVQGQLNLTGTVNHAQALFAAVRGVLTETATFVCTAFEFIDGMYIDSLLTTDISGAGIANLLHLANHGNGTTRSTIDNAIYIRGIAVTNLFNFKVADQASGFVSSAGGKFHGGTMKQLSVLIDEVQYYMLASTAPTSS